MCGRVKIIGKFVARLKEAFLWSHPVLCIRTDVVLIILFISVGLRIRTNYSDPDPDPAKMFEPFPIWIHNTGYMTLLLFSTSWNKLFRYASTTSRRKQSMLRCWRTSRKVYSNIKLQSSGFSHADPAFLWKSINWLLNFDFNQIICKSY